MKTPNAVKTDELDLALALGAMLPYPRPVIVDLAGGDGSLLSCCLDQTTAHGLVCDASHTHSVKAPARRSTPFEWHRITADIAQLYALLVEVEWRADLFVANAHHQPACPRKRLLALEDSDCRAVRDAYKDISGTVPAAAAIMLIALDRMTQRGDGLIIGDFAGTSTLLNSPLRQHVWLRVISDQRVALYFAKGHMAGIQGTITQPVDNIETAMRTVDRATMRYGQSVLRGSEHPSTVRVWDAVKTEWAQRRKPQRDDYHIRLEGDTLKTKLTRFDEHSLRTNRRDAALLFEMHGRTLSDLVLQVSSRDELYRMVHGTEWRVQPGVKESLGAAIAADAAVRAPLYPPAGAQRLAFLDSVKELTCTRDLCAQRWNPPVAGAHG